MKSCPPRQGDSNVLQYVVRKLGGRKEAYPSQPVLLSFKVLDTGAPRGHLRFMVDCKSSCHCNVGSYLNKTSFTVCTHGIPCRDFMRVRSLCRESISSFNIRLLFGACDSVMVVATHNRQEVCLPRVKLLSNGCEAVTLRGGGSVCTV